MCIRMCYKRARVEQTLGAGEECWPIALLCEERSEELLKRSEDDTFTCVRMCAVAFSYAVHFKKVLQRRLPQDEWIANVEILIKLLCSVRKRC